MVANATTLAEWLRAKPRFKNIQPMRTFPPSAWQSFANDRQGIIFFKDYWRRRGQYTGNGTGDHIDLWNRDTLTSGFVSFLRFTLGIASIPNPFGAADEPNFYSDLGASAKICFWGVS